MIAGSLLSAWAVHEKAPFHLTNFVGALGAAATLGLAAGPYWVAGGTAHAASNRGDRSNGKPALRTAITMRLRSGKAAFAVS